MEPDDVAPAAPAVPTPVANATMPTLEEIAASMEANAGVAKPVRGGLVELPDPDAPPVETAEVPATPPVRKPDPQSARFAALARREREARQAKADADRRIAEADARSRDLEAREAKVKSAKTPLQVLQAAGFKYEDATMEAVGAFEAPEVDPATRQLDERLSPLQEQQEQLKIEIKKVQDLANRLESDRMTGLERQAMSEIREAVATGGYEYIGVMGEEGYKFVKDVILDYAQKTKRLLNYSEACDIVEGYYEKKFKPIAATNKFKSGLTPTAPVVSPKQSPSSPTPAKVPTRTLTQAQTTGSRTRPDLDKLPGRDALDWIAANMLKYSD
jgi:hypothetical protein